MYPQNLTQENIDEILLIHIEQLEDQQLVDYGYQLQSIWDNLEEDDVNSDVLCQRMREVYHCVLTRAQKTKDLERLAILVPALPYLIYSPNLPEEEGCFEPVDDLVWGFAKSVSETPDVSDTIKEIAVKTLMVETKGIDEEDLMVEPVYVWAVKQSYLKH